MVLEDLEIPQFSDLKPFVVDAAVWGAVLSVI